MAARAKGDPSYPSQPKEGRKLSTKKVTIKDAAKDTKTAEPRRIYERPPKRRDWLPNAVPIALVFVILLLNSWASPSTVSQYIAKRFDGDSDSIIGQLYTIDYVSSVVGAIIADNFLGRYAFVTGSIAFASLAFLGMAIGSMEMPRVGWTALDVGSMIVMSALAGSIRGSLLPFIGDQVSGNRKRLVVFAAVFPAYNLGYLFAYAFKIFAEKYQCFSTEQCYMVPFFTGSFVLLAVVVCLVIFRKKFIRQALLQGNVLSSICRIICYSTEMKRRTTGDKITIIGYAKDLDERLAEDLVRVGKTMFLLAVFSIYYIYYLTSEYTKSAQAGKMNLYKNIWFTIPIKDIDELIVITNFITGCLVVGYVCLFPKKFSVIRAMAGATGFMAFSTIALVSLEFWTRSKIFVIPEGHVRLSIINSLNCDVLAQDTNGSTLLVIPTNNTKSLSFTDHDINIKCDEGNESNIDLNKVVSISSSMNSAILLIFMKTGKVFHKKYERISQHPEGKALLIAYQSDIKVYYNKKFIQRTTTKDAQNNNETEFQWNLEPSSAGTDDFKISFFNAEKEFRGRMGAVYGVKASNSTISVVELLPAYSVNGGWQFIPNVLQSMAENLVFVAICEFTYTQAPAHLRAILNSLIFSSVFLSFFLQEFLMMIISLISPDLLINLTVSTVLGILAMLFGIWKLHKNGLHEPEPVEKVSVYELR